MSFHDHRLISATAKRARNTRPKARAFLRGVGDITFKPSRPQIHFGSVADDWRSVGDELREAMRRVELCD